MGWVAANGARRFYGTVGIRLTEDLFEALQAIQATRKQQGKPWMLSPLLIEALQDWIRKEQQK